jgi:hypothetical protein
MIDVVAAIVLTALAVTAPGILILASPVPAGAARRLAIGTGVWFAVVAALAALGLFSAASRIGTPAIGVAVLAPVLALALGAARHATVRRLALGIPLTALVAVNVGRVLGAFFVVLLAEGRLPRTFATSAGWGDIAVAVLAVPVALAVHRRAAGWRALTLAWNSLGLLDLVAAIALGVGSAPGSPLRFVYEGPESSTMGTLPWLLVPGFLVPIYILTHLAIFVRLAADGEGAGRAR